MGVLMLGLMAAPLMAEGEVYREDFEAVEVGALPEGYEGEVGSVVAGGFEGGKCLRVEGHKNNVVVRSPLIEFEPGATLQFTARVRVERERGTFWIQYPCYDEGGKMLCVEWGHDWLAQLGEPLPNFALINKVFRPHEAAAGTAQIRLVFKWYSDPEGVAWLDDIVIRQIAEAKKLTNARPVDLSAAANMGFRDKVAGDGNGGWTDQGKNDMRQLQPGPINFQGVPLHIIDPAENEGRSCIVLGGKAIPALGQQAEVRIGQRAEALLLLHNTAWSGERGRDAATFTVHYADGKTERFTIRSGIEATDWWTPTNTEASVVAYVTRNPAGGTVCLSLFEWRNPRPEAEIERIEVNSPGEPAYMLVAMTLADGGPVMPSLLSEARVLMQKWDDSWTPITLPWGVTEATATDFSFLQDAPCGKHGKLTARDGHFYWSDGTRARFFGTTVGWGGEVVEREVAEKIAAYLGRSGVNLTRIHISDDCRVEGAEQHLTWDPEKVDRLDYLIAQLKAHGVYVMFYTPMSGRYGRADGLLSDIGRYAKVIGTFDERMQELAREWWRYILTHENKYLGHPLVQDPTLAMIVLTNENELFVRVPYLLTEEYFAPYRDMLQERWNRWLVEQYGTREKLAEAWVGDEDAALKDDEDPAQGTVPLPLHRPALRMRDLGLFCDELQRQYYRDMIGFLRGLGVEVPITGTNHPYSRSGLRSLAEETDFVGMHFYWNHPSKGRTGNRSMLKRADPFAGANSLLARIAGAKVAGKPLIVGEWNIPWPNQYRHEMMLTTAAYGSLQDWDALIWFLHFAWVDESGEPRWECGTFHGSFDPPRGGLVPLAAAVFRRGDVQAARQLIEVESSDRTADLLAKAGRAADLPMWRGLRWLPYLSRVETNFMDSHPLSAEADAVISDDPLAFDDLAAAKRRMVHLDPEAEPIETIRDAYEGRIFLQNLARLRIPEAADREVPMFKPQAWGLPPGIDLPPGTGATATAGLSDDTCLQIGTLYLSDKGWPRLAEAYLDALSQSGMTELDAKAVQRKRLVSDTGELVTDHRDGVFTLNAPRCKALVTAEDEGSSATLDNFTLQTDRPSTVAVISLTDQPLGETPRALIVAVGDACLSGEQLYGPDVALAIATDEGLKAPEEFRVSKRGEPPMLLEPVAATVTLAKEARPVRCWALDGAGNQVAEVAVRRDGDGVRVSCARPGSMYYELAFGD